MTKAVFIDKDGTLIKDVPYNINAAFVEMEEHAGEALSLLKQNRYLLIVISNQSGVAKGFFLENDLEEINNEIQRKLYKHKVKIDKFYYCPHVPDGLIKEYSIECKCRKPQPGLILKAVKDFNINVYQSWMIGDILNDVEAGKSSGCKTILVDNGNETEWVLNEQRTPDYKVKDLRQAAEIILENDR
jgi:D,D-heptose 1,7-bisphosphate phosphatase